MGGYYPNVQSDSVPSSSSIKIQQRGLKKAGGTAMQLVRGRSAANDSACTEAHIATDSSRSAGQDSRSHAPLSEALPAKVEPLYGGASPFNRSLCLHFDSFPINCSIKFQSNPH